MTPIMKCLMESKIWDTLSMEELQEIRQHPHEATKNAHTNHMTCISNPECEEEPNGPVESYFQIVYFSEWENIIIAMWNGV